MARSEGPGLSFAAPIAEGTGEPEPDTSAAPSASAAASSAPPDAPPDPEALALRDQFEVTLRYDRGALSLVSARRKRWNKPIVTARRMGRWAVELWIGHELVERVRFDFPLLAAEEPPTTSRRKPFKAPPSFADSVSEQIVLVPFSPRATRAVLVDRATGASLALPWPLDASSNASASSSATPASSVAPLSSASATPTVPSSSATPR